MIGIDTVKVQRIADSIKNERFLTRVFTVGERDYYRQKGEEPETLAGIFAAKEAIAKAFGTGIRGFEFADIEISHSENGAPKVILYNGAKDLAAGKTVSVSISHDGDYAVAAAILL